MLTFVRVYLVFAPMLAQGIMGHPRRYYDSTGYGYLAAAQVLFLANLVWGWKRGPAAGDNPWGGATLEWQIPSPPPAENFDSDPVVTHGPYDFKKAGIL